MAKNDLLVNLKASFVLQPISKHFFTFSAQYSVFHWVLNLSVYTAGYNFLFFATRPTKTIPPNRLSVRQRGGGWGGVFPQVIMTSVPSIEIWKQVLAGILNCPEKG